MGQHLYEMLLRLKSRGKDYPLTVRFDLGFLAITEYGIAHAIGFWYITYPKQRTF
jgi:hypothetical protein